MSRWGTESSDARELRRVENDRYEVERLLGRGGFGEVYLARYRGRHGFSRRVALKVLRPDRVQDEELARRVRDEARLLGLVHHRAVVAVDRLVQLEGRWCVVMEFVDGVNLDALARERALPLRVALEIVAEVCRALHACLAATGPDGRSLELLHRDIKPSNILVTRHGDVKLLDFGIAHAAFDEREAETRSLVFGTAGYMAPERFELICGAPADIYALGVVLYEILTRQRFGRSSPNPARHLARVDASLDTLQQRCPDAPPALRALLREVLACDPAARPDARALEARVTALLEVLPPPTLLRWAEGAVDPAAAQVTVVVEPDSGEEGEGTPPWTGRVLNEDRGTLAFGGGAESGKTSPALGLGDAPRVRWARIAGVVLGLVLTLSGIALLGTCRKEPPTEGPSRAVVAAGLEEAAGASEPEEAPAPPLAPPEPAPEEPKPLPSGKPVRAPRTAICKEGEVQVTAANGSSNQGIEVEKSAGGWSRLPACVPWSPLLNVRRPSKDGAVTGAIGVSSGRAQVKVACDAARCWGEFGP